MEQELYIERNVIKYSSSLDYTPINSNDNKYILSEVVFQLKNILLLGNPGSGKTKELKRLFEKLWDTHENTGFFPLFINLKRFTRNHSFEEHITFKQWRQLPSIIFILDGLDECVDPHHTISELELFIEKHKAKQNYRFLVSSRLNIYHNNQLSLNSFLPFLLLELTEEEIINFIFQSTGFKDELRHVGSNPLYSNPFCLKRIVEYYLETGEWIESNSEFWKRIIHLELKQHSIKTIKSGKILEPILTTQLQQVAVLCELQNRNQINESELCYLLGHDYDSFINNPFFNPFYDDSVNDFQFHSFRHRQYQEFFVASKLAEISWIKLNEFIFVPDTHYIKASLENVIGMTLSLIKEDTRNKLISLLMDNNLEILLRIGNECVNESVRKEVFQNQFELLVVQECLPIDYGFSFSQEDLTRFSNIKDNFIFLLNQIENVELAEFIRLESFSLLEGFTIFDEPSAKKLLENVLNSQNSNKIKSAAFRLIRKWSFQNDLPYFTSILDWLDFANDKKLNHEILLTLTEAKQVDDYFAYILKLSIHLGEDQFSRDPYSRSNNWIRQTILLRLNRPENFIEFGSHLLNQFYITYDKKYCERIGEKINGLMKQSTNLLVNLINVWFQFDKTRYHNIEDFLFEITVYLKVEEEVFFGIIKNVGMEHSKWLLANIANQQIISSLIYDIPSLKKIDKSHLLGFRNILSHENLDLALELQSALFGIGIISKEDLLPSKSEREEFELLNNSMVQENFDSLFETQLIISKLEVFFESRELDEITQEKLRELELQYYKESQQWFYNLSLELVVLKSALRCLERVTFDSICTSLQDSDLIKLTSVNDMLKNSMRKKPEIVVSSQKKGAILSWLRAVSEEVNFSEILIIYNLNEFSFKSPNGYRDYLRLELIYDFLDIELEYYKKAFQKEFFLDSMSFYNLKVSDPFDEHFSHLLNGIDSPIIEERIRKNLESLYFSFTGERQMVYAMNNQFKSIFPLIREYLIESDNLYPSDAFFDLYMQKTDDYQLMSEISERLDSHRSWEALSKLLDREDKMYEAVCRERILGYLKSEDSEFKAKAISLLLRLGDNLAMDYLLEDFELYSQNQGISYKYSHDYKLPIEKLRSILTDFFTKIYVTLNHQDFEFQHLNAFFLNTIINSLRESVGEEDRESNTELINHNYTQIRSAIESIDIEALIGPNSTSQIKFYHKNALSNLELTYIDLLSKPMSFTEALKKTKELFA